MMRKRVSVACPSVLRNFIQPSIGALILRADYTGNRCAVRGLRLSLPGRNAFWKSGTPAVRWRTGHPVVGQFGQRSLFGGRRWWIRLGFNRLCKFLPPRIIVRLDHASHPSEMGDILSDTQSRQHRASLPIVGHISGDVPDNLDAISDRGVDHGAATDSVDRDAIDKIPIDSPGADAPRKETQGVLSNTGKTEPADLHSNRQVAIGREEWYQLLWKFKLILKKENNR